jgi:hypothetical protein
MAGALLLALALAGCGSSSTNSAAQTQGSVLVHDSGGGMTELLGATWLTACEADTGGGGTYFFESLQFATGGTLDTYNEYSNAICTSLNQTRVETIFVSTAGDQPNASFPAGAGPVTATRMNVSGGHQGPFKALGYVVLGPPDTLYVTDESAPTDADGYPTILQNYGRVKQ